MTDIFKNLTSVLNSFGPKLLQDYKSQLQSSKHVASGNLISSLEYEVSWSGGLVELSISLEDYWKYLEYGRRPGKFPPPNKILEWIKVKPIAPRPMKNGKLPTQEQLAFLIGRKIAEKGIQGTNDLEQAENNLWNQFEREMDEALDKDLGEETDEIIQILWK